MIFYFSGTGNSQLAAKEIGAVTGEPVVSINQLLKEGAKGSFQSDGPLVFVTPTYAWRMPRVVEQWIREAHFEGNPNAYFVLTCGVGCGNAAAYAQKLCTEKGLRFCGLAPVVMPENYLAMFATPSEGECQAILEKAVPEIQILAQRIQRGENFPAVPGSAKDKLLSGPVNTLFYQFAVTDKGFTVSDSCISCGKCAQRCPLGNIGIASGKPVWKGNCTHCMACIAGCPTQAIEYQSKSKGQHRHYIMED